MKAYIERISQATNSIRFALKDETGKTIKTARAFQNARAIDQAYNILIAEARRLGLEMAEPFEAKPDTH